MSKRSLRTGRHTLAFKQLEARPTLGAEIPTETVLTVQGTTP